MTFISQWRMYGGAAQAFPMSNVNFSNLAYSNLYLGGKGGVSAVKFLNEKWALGLGVESYGMVNATGLNFFGSNSHIFAESNFQLKAWTFRYGLELGLDANTGTSEGYGLLAKSNYSESDLDPTIGASLFIGHQNSNKVEVGPRLTMRTDMSGVFTACALQVAF